MKLILNNVLLLRFIFSNIVIKIVTYDQYKLAIIIYNIDVV